MSEQRFYASCNIKGDRRARGTGRGA